MLCQLAIVPAWASIQTGTSTKKQGGENDIDLSLSESLFQVYMGTGDDDTVSFADLLCNLSGPFEAYLISNQFGTIKTIQVTDENCTATTADEECRLQLADIWRIDDYLVLNEDTRIKIRNATLTTDKKVDGRLLLKYFT